MRFVALAAIGLLAACDQTAPVANNAAAAADNAAVIENAAAPLGVAPPTREAALKLMHDRHEGMEEVGKANKAITQALKSDAPDLAVIRTSAARLAELAEQSGSWFPPGTGPEVGKTRAKPAIWEKPADFAAKDRDFLKAAQAFNAAAQAGDLAAIRAAHGDLGKTCKACHDPYRAEEKDHD
jgi:cytochrome c556